VRPEVEIPDHLRPQHAGDVRGRGHAATWRKPRIHLLGDGAAADDFAPFDYQDNADFKVLSFRTTNVLRWEFKPGSTLFVVWQQGREGFMPDGSFTFGRDYRDVFSTPSSNAVLVKLAYWFNP